MDVSVIIPTRDSLREKHFCLAYTLRALALQRGVEFEVIVVNDGGTDGSVDSLTPSDYPVRILHRKTDDGNVGAARNLGARHAVGEFLVFLDDDTILFGPHTISTVATLLRNGSHFVCGALRYWTNVNWNKSVTLDQSTSSILQTLKAISILPRGINRLVGYRDLNEFTFFGNFGTARATLFKSIGGFDEEFPGWGYEDIDIMMRFCLLPANHCLLWQHGVTVIHLTHPRRTENDHAKNTLRFSKLEIERGYYFHANHFFGVYEGDGHQVVTKLS